MCRCLPVHAQRVTAGRHVGLDKITLLVGSGPNAQAIPFHQRHRGVRHGRPIVESVRKPVSLPGWTDGKCGCGKPEGNQPGAAENPLPPGAKPVMQAAVVFQPPESWPAENDRVAARLPLVLQSGNGRRIIGRGPQYTPSVAGKGMARRPATSPPDAHCSSSTRINDSPAGISAAISRKAVCWRSFQLKYKPGSRAYA